MNYRLMIIEEAIKGGVNVPLDMVIELAASGQDVSAYLGHIDGYEVIDSWDD